MKLFFRFSMSMTRGMKATTRLSTAAVVQVVHPRLEAPATTNLSMVEFCSFMKAVTVSIARTAALVIGMRAGHVSSPVLR